MPKEKLKSLVHQLRDEIEQQTSLSPEQKTSIENLVDSIEQSVETDSATKELNDSISETITEFETNYPRLTAIVNDIMVTLSNMGI